GSSGGTDRYDWRVWGIWRIWSYLCQVMSGGGASSPLPAMNLCWDGIVKNESARIERCVNSLLPHVSCAIVVDTGSTDGTPHLITQLFKAAGKPVEVYNAEFIDFSQARNEALRVARASS